MFEKIKALFIKYRELISYVFFGGLTTVVSFGSYFILNMVFHVYYLHSQIISWILAVAFAFVTNKKFVFNNNEKTIAGIIVQIVQFYVSRIFCSGSRLCCCSVWSPDLDTAKTSRRSWFR